MLHRSMSAVKPTLEAFIKEKGVTSALHERASFKEALSVISSSNEGVAFIVDDGNRLVGVLSDGDIRRHMGASPDFSDKPLSELMTHTPVCMKLHEDFDQVLSRMRLKKINALAIVNDDGTYRGSITLHEILAFFSPERVYIDDTEKPADENLERHISRYRFASQFIQRGASILDCACGSGYGSHILSRQAGTVTGVDHSTEAIAYAKSRYSGEKMCFIEKKIEHLDFAPESFDALISFETIEHISEEACRIYLKNAVSWIRKGGIFIVSSPMLRYKDNAPYVTNPYHINEMDKKRLIGMFGDIFSGCIIHYYHQKQDVFLPLSDEHTGFMVAVGRKSD